jgi:cellobiose phosphorylase
MKSYKVRRVFRGAVYDIEVINESGAEGARPKLTVDGQPIEGCIIKPIPGKREYNVRVTL